MTRQSHDGYSGRARLAFETLIAVLACYFMMCASLSAPIQSFGDLVSSLTIPFHADAPAATLVVPFFTGFARDIGFFFLVFGAFILGGMIGLFCEQSALHVGPLAVSQPFIVIVDPLVSVLLGVWLYHEQLQVGAGHLAVGVVGFAVMCGGIVAMTQTAPPSLSVDVRRI